ncbi:AEC family transporter [Cochlodiniinecator piscidefendens]|uniref:AEC family transporter n=1 Tax=Cochlodiniinecator piscidefendens TaxID=2715756 RepID=UPI00140AC660|nr:AEC family transporter [Cochlodiniinecator piscidefendens]
MQALIDVILPVFITIGFGYIAVYKGFFKTDYVDGLMKFTQNFAIPALLFRAISTLDLGQNFNPGLLISYYSGAIICFLVGIYGARYLFQRDWEDAIVIGFCCLFSNTVLLGLPITERAFGTDALASNYAIIAIHAPFCYGVGITVMEVVRNRGSNLVTKAKSVLNAMFHNALVLAIAAGLFVNLSGLYIPVTLTDALDLLARAGLPAALFGLGGVLVRYRPEGDLRAIFFVCFVALFVQPFITLVLGNHFELSDQALRSAIITAAMAPGINGYIFANMYGRAQRVAASSVLFATGATILTAWGWLSLLP